MPTLPEELQQAEGPWLPRAFSTATRHYGAGLFDEARQLLVLILEREPRHADSMFLMASIAGQSGDLDLAEDFVKQALSVDPNRAHFWVLLGNIAERRNLMDDAETCFRKATEADPSYADGWFHLGRMHERRGEHSEATRAFIRAVALKHDHLDALFHLSNQHRLAGRFEEAVRLLEVARRDQPESVPVLVNLASAYVAHSRRTEALECFNSAISLSPGAASLYNQKGNVLAAMGRVDAALAAFAKAVDLEPRRAAYWANRGRMLARQGRHAEALGSFRTALECDPVQPAAHSAALVSEHYDAATGPESLREEHRIWGERHASRWRNTPRLYANTLDPEKRLRIGYVSACFHRHPTAYFLAPVLELHAAHAFCYSTGAESDSWTERLRRTGSVWRDAANLSDDELAAQIQSDQIDILIDLDGHQPGHRLLVFARRPAPVQMTWLGYPDTTGLPAIDYILLDSIVAPEEEDPAPFIEQPIRLPGCYAVYSGPEYAPQPAPPPCLHTGHITYGCFDAASHLTTHTIELWCRLLHADPRAHLMLKNNLIDDEASRDVLRREFARHSIAPERIQLWGSSPHAGVLAWYANIDIALDPYPLSGPASLCEALWMGVPVVTLAGNRFNNRVGATLLAHAGLSEWITRSPEDYVERALALGADTEILRRIRLLLRDQVRRSSLGDTKGFVRRLEDAYRNAWRAYCARQNAAESHQ